VNFVDPLGLYGSDVHYNLTEELALRAGFSKRNAWLIAKYDQAFDDNWETSPWNPFGGTWQHFQSPEDASTSLRVAICNKDVKAFGEALHMYQDTFSHYNEGYRWYSGGHVIYSLAGYYMDFDTDEYIPYSTRDTRMRKETSYYLEQFYKAMSQE
jgi:hypothetical protein